MSADLQEQVNALISLSTGLDVGRRVGWAKYYDAMDGQVREHDNAIRLLGKLIGTLIEGAELLPRQSLIKVVRGIAFQVLTEPGDQEIFDRAVSKAREYTFKRFSESSTQALAIQSEREVEHRCASCSKLLLLENAGWLSLKCDRCGRPNDIEKEDLFGGDE